MIDWSPISGAVALFVLGLVSPGPNVLVIARASLARGRRAGLITGAGVVAGDTFYAALGLLGLSGAIAAGGRIGTILRIAGGAYLVWLGLRMIAGRTKLETGGDAAPARGRALFRTGFLTVLANASTIAFFTSIFAVVITPATSVATRLALLAVLAGTSAVWRLILAQLFAAAWLRARYERARRVIEPVMGTLLGALGLKVALQR